MFSAWLINLFQIGVSLSGAYGSLWASTWSTSWFTSSLKYTLSSCLCGVDSVGEPLGRLLVVILSVKFLSWFVSALVQCSSTVCIYTYNPINFMNDYSINCTGRMGWSRCYYQKFHKLLYVKFWDHSNAYFITQYICMGYVIPLPTSSGCCLAL